eukprot:CAMPEP_0197464678 /NCGR_PEP_ID=MMETSP1175-20131217/64145_1 /TAXON_ID=1003142 /ORGANISM="Triceratium dubium, Strain CCMP147" /LENGTH=155 /DNA_ID=CAMNT_0043000663 /DNA_START=81 /DNA_END=548 /DNA_ORIENTATION=-
MMMKNITALLLLAISFTIGNAASLTTDDKRKLGTTCGTCDAGNNPCQAGGTQLYFPLCGARRRYVQCDESGGCFEKRCAKGTRWNQDFQACVHKKCGGECRNRCKSKDVAAGDFYRPHCSDETKYQQCDASGGCFERHCAPGTVWSDAAETCVEP